MKELRLRGVTIRGRYNEILTRDIGQGTVLSGWTFVGRNVKIGRRCHIANFVEINNNCIIGDETSIQVYVVLNSGTKVGSRCLLAGHVGTTDEKYPTPFTETISRRPCMIGDDVIVGEGAKLSSVTLGDGCVIGTASNVLHDVPAREVWVGNPAKPLRLKTVGSERIMTRADFEAKRQAYLRKR